MMHEPLQPEIEEVLEHLYLGETEALEWHPTSGNRAALSAAVAAGYLTPQGDAYVLSDTGRVLGRTTVRRHRLAECLLHDVLAVSADRLHGDACRLEHDLQHGLDDRVCTLLGHPRQCPHGKPIPRGDCCTAADAGRSEVVSPLSEGSVGHQGIVAYLSTRDNHEVQKLMAMGVLPGSEIGLVRRFPSYVFTIGFSQFTVDQTLAEKIHVHWREPGEEPRT